MALPTVDQHIHVASIGVQVSIGILDILPDAGIQLLPRVFHQNRQPRFRSLDLLVADQRGSSKVEILHQTRIELWLVEGVQLDLVDRLPEKLFKVHLER